MITGRQLSELVQDQCSMETLMDFIGLTVRSDHGDEVHAHCPINSDNNPSFYYNKTNGFYNCHGCSIKGGIVSMAFEWIKKERSRDWASYHEVLALLKKLYPILKDVELQTTLVDKKVISREEFDLIVPQVKLIRVDRLMPQQKAFFIHNIMKGLGSTDLLREGVLGGNTV